jgi:hypothetical protein
MKAAIIKNRPQFTGNAGLNYIAWQLSRRGWHVTPTIRNARGSDMFVTDADENIKFGVQSKALSKRHSVPLGLNLEILRSEWWIITVHANSENPVCYVMRLEEVQRLATQDSMHGNYWLIAKSYDRPEFREAWHRIDHIRQRNDPSCSELAEARALPDSASPFGTILFPEVSTRSPREVEE